MNNVLKRRTFFYRRNKISTGIYLYTKLIKYEFKIKYSGSHSNSDSRKSFEAIGRCKLTQSSVFTQSKTHWNK